MAAVKDSHDLPAFRAGMGSHRCRVVGAKADRTELTPRRHDEPTFGDGVAGSNAPESPDGDIAGSTGSGGPSVGGIPPGGKLPAVQLLQQRSHTVSITGFHTFFLTVLSLRTSTLTVFTQQSQGAPKITL